MIVDRLRSFAAVFAALFAVSVGSSSARAEGRHVIISDVDDTFKITHVNSTVDAIINGLFSRKAFTGMNAFYRAQRYSPLFVSGSIEPLRNIIDGFFEEQSLEHYRLFLRESYFEKVQPYKVEVISSIIQRLKSDVTVVLIGDDTEFDPEAFAEVSQLFPEKVAAVYVRSVKNRPIHAGQIQIQSALDLALREATVGRLSDEGLQSVIASLSRTGSDDLIFPDFVDCPRQLEWSKLASDEATASAVRPIEERLMSFCESRSQIAPAD